MKYVLIILLCFNVLSTSAQQSNLEIIRLIYLDPNKDEKDIKKLLELCDQYSSTNKETVHGYKISAAMMLLSFSSNPIEKFKIFQQKSKEMDDLIFKNMDNIEIRLLRYSLQSNAPNLLNYNNNKLEDLIFIKRNVKNIKGNLKKHVYLVLESLKTE